MKHSMSPKITAIEVLMGIPPIDIYCSSIEVKFLIKSVNKDDLITATHVKTTRPSSLSSLLLSKLRRFERTHMSHSYTRDSIKAFIRDNWNRRWNSPYNDNFLRNFISNLPQETIHSPLLGGNPLIANMISDLLIGSSRRLAENGWLLIGRIFLVERAEVEPFDRIAGIEWNAVEFYRICCMAWSLRSLRQVATLRHGHLARRSVSFRSCIQATRGM